MALRNLAMKLRTSASPARRFLSGTRDSQEPGCRNLPFAGCSADPTEVAKDWYMLQRGRYDDLKKELANLSRLVLWTEKLERFLRRSYQVGAPLTAGFVVLQCIAWQKADAAAREQADEAAREQADEAVRKQSDEAAREQADEAVRKQADEAAREQADEAVRKQADEAAREQADEAAREQADEAA